MHRPIHFEILADDPEAIARFYEAVLGWKSNRWQGGQDPDQQPEQAYWLVTTGEDPPGIDGGIMHRHFEQPVINTVQVPSLDEVLAKVEAAGGSKIHGPNEIPGVGNHVYCADPEGNVFGLLEPAPREA